jgi:hypothetical protein
MARTSASHGMTPAMNGVLTDRIWSVEELLEQAYVIMASIASFYLENGQRQLAVFELEGTLQKPFVIIETVDTQGVDVSKLVSLNPGLLQKMHPGNNWGADYYYKGEIAFPRYQDTFSEFSL